MKKALSKLLDVVGVMFSIFCFLLAGCMTAGVQDHVTPTMVPPLTEALGYDVPNVKGITTVGILKFDLRLEQEKLKVYGVMSNEVIKATEDARASVLEIAGMLGLGGYGLLPLAAKKVPKGYKPETP